MQGILTQEKIKNRLTLENNTIQCLFWSFPKTRIFANYHTQAFNLIFVFAFSTGMSGK
jgi:hypothetical protein